MSKSLSIRVHEDKLLWELIKAVGYGGWPFRELSVRLKPLIDQYGSRKVSAALIELAMHTGWRTMLNPVARKAAWGVLGPAPEQWSWYYTDWQGKPTPRPDHHKEPPVIPPPQPDPFLESLTRLVYTELEAKLKEARGRKDASDIGAVESEMIRRGMDLPPQEAEKPAGGIQEETQAKPKKSRAKAEKK